ncbi:MAG TPA: dickkopf-related protein, partial [bacterium]|nr:dickkopf-related protein [bacterium]
MSSFSVKPVKNYKPGYPVKGFFRRSFVIAVPIKLFSLLVVGFLFFITVPGCFEQEMRTDGVQVPDFDTVTDNDNSAPDEIIGLPDPPDDSFLDNDTADIETNDFDQIDGGAVPECLEDKDCEEGYYCDLTTYTCVEQLLGDPIPDQEVSDDVSDETEVQDETEVPDEEVPDETLSGIAPP